MGRANGWRTYVPYDRTDAGLCLKYFRFNASYGRAANANASKAWGRRCGTLGAGCFQLTDCGNDAGRDCAALPWTAPRSLMRGLQRRHRWLVFLGDSDTRGLVLALLQVLAEAGVGAEAAAGNMSHWFGDGLNVSAAPPGQTQAQAQRLAAARICHMDWSYDERGRVVSRRTWPCLAAPTACSTARCKATTRRWSPGPSTYARVGQHYELARGAAGAPLRVTFISTNTPELLSEALRQLGQAASSVPALLGRSTPTASALPRPARPPGAREPPAPSPPSARAPRQPEGHRSRPTRARRARAHTRRPALGRRDARREGASGGPSRNQGLLRPCCAEATLSPPFWSRSRRARASR